MPGKIRSMLRSAGNQLLYSGLTALVVFGAVEGAFRIAGYNRPATVESMAFTFPIDDYNRDAPVPFLQRDDVLFWKPRPLVLGHNSRGVFGPEFKDAKDPRQFRIVALGDSCTHFGPDPYPQRLQAMLDTERPGRFDVINAGVIGYSSFQGLTRLKHEVSGWGPDLVTVYFGWNDHWLARGYPDREQLAARGVLDRLRRALDRLRFYQWLESVFARRPSLQTAVQYRVSLTDYADNLREMKRAADGMGARLWLITAPHALDLGIPPYLATSGEVADMAGLIALHGRYNDQVRAVARETGATLVDLDRLIGSMDKTGLFIDDHIHLSDTGKTLAAQTLLAAMKEQRLIR